MQARAGVCAPSSLASLHNLVFGAKNLQKGNRQIGGPSNEEFVAEMDERQHSPLRIMSQKSWKRTSFLRSQHILVPSWAYIYMATLTNPNYILIRPRHPNDIPTISADESCHFPSVLLVLSKVLLSSSHSVFKII